MVTSERHTRTRTTSTTTTRNASRFRKGQLRTMGTCERAPPRPLPPRNTATQRQRSRRAVDEHTPAGITRTKIRFRSRTPTSVRKGHSSQNDTSKRSASDTSTQCDALVFLRKGQLNRHTTHTRCTDQPLPHETVPRSGRVARWTNTPSKIFKDPPPVPAKNIIHRASSFSVQEIL